MNSMLAVVFAHVPVVTNQEGCFALALAGDMTSDVVYCAGCHTGEAEMLVSKHVCRTAMCAL